MGKSIEFLVHCALNNSVENGYEKEILNQSIRETALDLTDCDVNLENIPLDQIKPFVESWLKKKGIGK